MEGCLDSARLRARALRDLSERRRLVASLVTNGKDAAIIRDAAQAAEAEANHIMASLPAYDQHMA
ncbi:hypothetical protein HL653_11750 [Sphingomonas sp. AP4-R1]|uniref:hypothetical protein n=1 Tax=Sphingomonas sp. AP4-R1 TaxID=2735134 RepID=UPI00149374D8|nr:hypothetical protein [Sphingomonas sp. AP4-R1]QJU58360.1 hypothetical protein HL653_11750 [Sphingomonas sp. AP4-R1]